jgi:hypothetical protein
MKDDILTVKTYYYMPYRGIWAVGLLAAGGGLIQSGRFILGLVALFLAAMVLTAHYGIKIHQKNKTYNDFLSILGFVSGEEKSYRIVDYVFIKSSKKSQTMNSLITSRTFTDDFYDGYIKFDEDEKVYLLTHKNKARVMTTLEELSSGLGVDIVDHTIEN